jgi:4'-phosphopantetheinyl transferase
MNSRIDAIAHPKGKEIHVWHLNLGVMPVNRDAFWKALAPAERDRCSQFRSDIHKQRFIAAQGALRCLLSCYLGIAPHTVQFERNQHGKPRLAGTEPDRGLVFNLSHSGDQALVAVGVDMPLGVDLEIRRPLTHIEGLVERCFAPSERNRWCSLPPSHRLAAFFNVWTCKEAFIKAVGRGLGLGLTRCVLASGEVPRWETIPESCGNPDEWSLRSLDLGENISAALCARATDIHWRLNELDPFPR